MIIIILCVFIENHTFIQLHKVMMGQSQISHYPKSFIVKEFTRSHPGKVDLVKWVLFDDKTMRIYEKELASYEASEIVNSPQFYEINRILRNGGN